MAQTFRAPPRSAEPAPPADATADAAAADDGPSREQAHADDAARAIRAVFAVAAVLFLLFWWLDSYVDPARAAETGWVRAGTALFLSLLVPLTYRARPAAIRAIAGLGISVSVAALAYVDTRLPHLDVIRPSVLLVQMALPLLVIRLVDAGVVLAALLLLAAGMPALGEGGADAVVVSTSVVLAGAFLSATLAYLRIKSRDESVTLQRMLREREARRAAESATDPLTGLPNRRRFMAAAGLEYERVQRLNAPVALVMIDIDRFKQVNDTWGHGAGDRVLIHLARVWSAAHRQIDLLARIGGEEFVLLLPGSDLEAARAAAERLRAATRATAIAIDGRDLSVTASFGCARRAPGESVAETLKRADRALYQAKESGRDRVVALPEP